MAYPLSIAIRYLRSKKAAFVSVGTAFAILGVALGVAALATVMSVTLSCDHRALDGAKGAEIVAAFKGLIEKPLSMLV